MTSGATPPGALARARSECASLRFQPIRECAVYLVEFSGAAKKKLKKGKKLHGTKTLGMVVVTHSHE